MRELELNELEEVVGADATGMLLSGTGGAGAGVTVVGALANAGFLGGNAALGVIGLSNPLGWAIVGGFALGAGLYCLLH